MNRHQIILGSLKGHFATITRLPKGTYIYALLIYGHEYTPNYVRFLGIASIMKPMFSNNAWPLINTKTKSAGLLKEPICFMKSSG